MIYITSGAGGAGLYSVAMQADPAKWKEFTYKFFSEQHSLSVIDVNGKTFHLRQISDTGNEVDSFEIEK